MSISAEAAIGKWERQIRAAQFIKAAPTDPRQMLARLAINHLRWKFRALGIDVRETTYRCPWDLVLQDILRVEVKASRWCAHGWGGRYQAEVRKAQLVASDIVIFAVRCDGRRRGVKAGWHFFIIPAGLIRSRTLEITSRDPLRYKGQWARFREAWPILNQALREAGERPRQLILQEAEDATNQL